MHMHGPGRGWCKGTLEVYLKCGVVAAHSGMKVTQGKGHDARPSKGEELRITEEEGKPDSFRTRKSKEQVFPRG